MLSAIPTFAPRSHRTALPGWRLPSRRRPALRDCSLVIPTSDRRDGVERLLEALLALPDAPGEVVIVDADPARTLGADLRAWSAGVEPPFALIYVASPPGLTRQRNVGVDISTRDFIFFLDPGVEPLSGYFAATRRVFDLDRDRCVGGVAGVVVNPPAAPLLFGVAAAFAPPRSIRPFFGLRRVDVLPGSASAWRREVFAGRRFSCFFGAWPEGEDLEMSLHVGKSWTLLACGEARVRTIAAGRAVLPGYHAGRARVRNRFFIRKRHLSRPAPKDTAHFWLAAVLDAATDLMSFCLRPWRPARLCHAAGILAGIASCLTAPPAFVEPPARAEYLLTAESLAAKTGN